MFFCFFFYCWPRFFMAPFFSLMFLELCVSMFEQLLISWYPLHTIYSVFKEVRESSFPKCCISIKADNAVCARVRACVCVCLWGAGASSLLTSNLCCDLGLQIVLVVGPCAYLLLYLKLRSVLFDSCMCWTPIKYTKMVICYKPFFLTKYIGFTVDHLTTREQWLRRTSCLTF